MPHKDPEARKAYLKEYARKNREKLREYQLAYRQGRSEELRAYNRDYQKAYYHVAVKVDAEKVLSNRLRAAKWYAANPERAKLNAKASCTHRRKVLDRVTPVWADKGQIKAIYAQAMRLTKETGIQHEVDHIVPLRGKSVQGLHCEANLRVVTMAENRSKGSRHIS